MNILLFCSRNLQNSERERWIGVREIDIRENEREKKSEWWIRENERCSKGVCILKKYKKWV